MSLKVVPGKLLTMILVGLTMICFSTDVLADWMKACNGNIPNRARPQGKEANGDPLWLARAKVQSKGVPKGVHPGKVRPAFQGANVPYGGKELKAKCYEVWVGPARWVKAHNGDIPPKAVPAGKDANGQTLYAARAWYADGLHLGKVRPEFGGANIPYGGKEVKVRKYEVLCHP